LYVGSGIGFGRCCHEQAFQEPCTSATETSPSHCRRTEGVIGDDVEKMGSPTEEEFIRPGIKRPRQRGVGLARAVTYLLGVAITMLKETLSQSCGWCALWSHINPAPIFPVKYPMEQFGRALLPMDSAAGLPTLSRYNFTCGAISCEVITRFEPR
jgi:hypothetical protein